MREHRGLNFFRGIALAAFPLGIETLLQCFFFFEVLPSRLFPSAFETLLRCRR